MLTRHPPLEPGGDGDGDGGCGVAVMVVANVAITNISDVSIGKRKSCATTAWRSDASQRYAAFPECNSK